LSAFNYVLADGWVLGDMVALVLTGLWASIAVGWFMSYLAEKNFGAVNGDVLGATNEISRPVVLIALLLLVAL
jgi:adenosylcobinamide-GDP ribazoletransferase